MAKEPIPSAEEVEALLAKMQWVPGKVYTYGNAGPHDDACEQMIRALSSALAAAEVQVAALTKQRDEWKEVARRSGVCMTCALGAPDTFGCTDCLNTGWEGGSPCGYVPEAQVAALTATLDAQASPQCCMCGKTGLSTVEGDAGTECQLSDGRWTCSAECYYRATDAQTNINAATRSRVMEAAKIVDEFHDIQFSARYPDGREKMRFTSFDVGRKIRALAKDLSKRIRAVAALRAEQSQECAGAGGGPIPALPPCPYCGCKSWDRPVIGRGYRCLRCLTVTMRAAHSTPQDPNHDR